MKTSAGLLLHRHRDGLFDVFLVHPGGPFWARKDDGAWSIPKGEIEAGEDPFDAAQREFTEETGYTVTGDFVALTTIRQTGGKVVHAWAVEADIDAAGVRSNTFTYNGREYPEVDRAAWFALSEARRKMLPSQLPLLDELERLFKTSS